MSNKQFDGVSFISQNKKECVLQLRLCEMKTSRVGFPPKCKPTNTDLPPPEVNEELLTVTASVQGEDGAAATVYQWIKRHQGKVAHGKIKAVKNEYLELTLTKTESKDWLRVFLDHLLEL